MTPLPLLVLCGFLFSLKIMLAKAALSAGMQPFQLGLLINLGSAVTLIPWLVSSGDKIPLHARNISLYFLLGIFSVTIPTLISYFILSKVGPAYTSTVYSLSPTLTMLFAALLGIELMFRRRILSIVIGFFGMIALMQQQIVQINSENLIWVFVGILIPASAAVGNVLRSAYWPSGASALAFSCGTLLTSALIFLLLSPIFEDIQKWRLFEPSIILWTSFLILISSLSSILNFRLQKIGGAVIFSQIGYWGTGFGVLLSSIIFGDILNIISSIGLMLIIYSGVLSKKK